MSRLFLSAGATYKRERRPVSRMGPIGIPVVDGPPAAISARADSIHRTLQGGCLVGFPGFQDGFNRQPGGHGVLNLPVTHEQASGA